MTWTQNYDPFGSPLLSTMLAALPVVLLLGLLAMGRVTAHTAAVAGLLTAVLAAICAFTPREVSDHGLVAWGQTVLAAAANGAAFGLFPIGWIVFSAIFLYSLTVEAGQFEIVKHSVVNLSADRRIQALLIAFSFGAFIEGAAGFGTPVAISAALMMGAGFRPLHAAGLALIANTAPVAYGALGTPIVTLARVTGLGELELSAMAGRQLPFFSVIVPVWLVWTMAGWRATVAIWPALLICGGSFALVQFLISNYHGPWLVDVAGGVVSLVATALFLKVWQPPRIWHFEHDESAAAPTPDRASDAIRPAEPGESSEPASTGIPTEPPGQAPVAASPIPAGTDSSSPYEEEGAGGVKTGQLPGYSPPEIMSAWVPWVVLTLFVFLWGIPQVKTFLGLPGAEKRAAFMKSAETVLVEPTYIGIKVPYLHKEIAREPPVVPRREEEPAVYDFGWLSSTGTGIFLAALVSAVWMGLSPARTIRVFLATCYRVRWPMFTIACMLAIAFTTRYSGMDATLGLAFTRTGYIYPLFAALLGWLGVALTGSDTSSNALFGSLQTITAGQLAAPRVLADGTVLPPILPLSDHQAKVLLAASNSTGGVMGKMIDAQSIVVASVATGQHNQEGAILRFVFWHSLVLAILMGILVMLQAYWLTWMIP